MAASAGVHLCFFVARTRCPAGVEGRGVDMGEERQGSGKGLGVVGVHRHAAESGYRHAS